MKKLSTSLALAMVVALLVATGAHALFFNNGSFEAGSWSPGWDGAGQRTFRLFTGGYTPSGFPNLSADGTGADLSAVVGSPSTAAMSIADPNTNGNLMYPAIGHYSARINSQDSSTSGGYATNANTLYQTTVVDATDVDPVDGKVHLRMMYAAVLVDPLTGHTTDEVPMFFLEVKDETTSTIIFHDQAYVGDASHTWNTGAAFGTGVWKYLDWQLIDTVAGDGSGENSIVGHTLSVQVVATGCSLGGHPGYVYVDEIGSRLPGPILWATAPATTYPNPATYTYTVNYSVPADRTNGHLSLTVPTGVTYVSSSLSDTACSESAGVITCDWPSIVTGNYSFTFDVQVNSGVTAGTTLKLDTYSIVADGTNTTIGTEVDTLVQTPPNTAPVANPDGYSTTPGTLLNATSVLGNDTDADLNSLTAIKVTDPAHAASFTFNSDGTFAYTPVASFSGQDSFTYKANDGTVDSNTTTVTIDVVPTLTIAASGAATVKPGDQYAYTFNYTVNATTTNTVVDFTLPGHTTFVSNTGGYTCTPAAGVVTCNLGTVSMNGSFTATVLVDKLKKVNTPLTLDTTAYSIDADSAVLTNGSATATANTLTPFADVPAGHWALDYVQSIWAYGITGGCVASPLTYCPNIAITRAEMAVYIERAVHGGGFNPGTPTLTFTDTATNFAKYFIEALKSDGITGGCGGTNYCPNTGITRAQMAVFLLRGRSGSAYIPPTATGTVWLDVPSTHWAAAWAEELGNAHISSGCGGGKYCPEGIVSRAEMAVLVQRTYNLPMPTP